MEKVNLRSYIDVLVRNRRIIVGVTLVATVISVLLSYFVIAPTYQVIVGFKLSQAPMVKLNQKSVEPLLGALASDQLPEISKLITNTYSVRLEDPALVARYRAANPQTRLPARVWAFGSSKLARVGVSRDSGLIEIHVAFQDAREAVGIAEFLAKDMAQVLKDQELQELSRGIAAADQQLAIRIPTLEAQVKQLDVVAQTMPKGITVTKTISDDAFLQAAAARLSNIDASRLIGLKVQVEEVNPAYAEVMSSLGATTAILTELREQHNTIHTIARDPKALAQLRTMDLTLVEPALVPLEPVGPKKLLSVVAAGVLGLTAGVFLAFFLEFWRNTTP